ncbi:MAG: mechanosensitive ion channel [Erysipelotrichaceae bacterium]|nr:mechanosensitive ion channel [Erysipelotrichaceae bacterium]MBR2551453.1 mechanosensitive ion channel [Erysipelotrichaceae bacterium]
MKKDLGKIIASVLVLAICLGLANVTGLDIRGFISNFHIDLESLLKVLIIVTGLLSIGYLLKFLVSLIRAPKLATLVTILRSGIDYAMLILIVVWSLRVLGADINGIIAGLGILALIIGTSAEGLIEDMLTGLFILFEQEYKVGDIIEVDEFLGTVTEIGIRTTCLKDNAGNEKIFNNSSMKDILNRSSYKSIAVVDLEVPDESLDKVLAADYGDIKCLGVEDISGEQPVVRFTKEVEEKDIYNARREMNLYLLKKFKELEIG